MQVDSYSWATRATSSKDLMWIQLLQQDVMCAAPISITIYTLFYVQLIFPQKWCNVKLVQKDIGCTCGERIKQGHAVTPPLWFWERLSRWHYRYHVIITTSGTALKTNLYFKSGCGWKLSSRHENLKKDTSALWNMKMMMRVKSCWVWFTKKKTCQTLFSNNHLVNKMSKYGENYQP